MNIFLDYLSKRYAEDTILLVCDGAAWHRSNAIILPENIKLLPIPPYTPEMNPIEQIWKQLRTTGFKNEVFQTLEDVMLRLCAAIRRLTKETISSITCRRWIKECFLEAI